ncbi:YqzL family protein [Ectobacillus sp. sgz5001026]
MLNFTWNVFTKTGSIETYLLIKELEQEGQEVLIQQDDELADFDSPIT